MSPSREKIMLGANFTGSNTKRPMLMSIVAIIVCYGIITYSTMSTTALWTSEMEKMEEMHQDELNALKAQMESVQKEKLDLTNEVASLKSSAKDCNSKITSLTADIEVVDSEVEDLEAQLEVMHAASDEKLETVRNASSAAKKDLMLEVESLKSTIGALTRELENAWNENEVELPKIKIIE